MNKCFYCKGEMKDDFCNYMVDLDGHFIIIKHVPCHKCSQEKYPIVGKSLHGLRKLLKS